MDLERNWLALPIRCGGMGLINPSAFARSQYRASRDITQPLVDCLLSGSKGIPFEVFESQCKVIEEYVKKKRNDLKVEKQKVRDCLSSDKQRLFDVACERGASVWLSALPLSDHGFDLNKGSFRDSICIRYGWQLQDLPSSCVCDSSFTVDHALSCPMGGFPTLRHNELRDLTALLMSEVCSNVSREPALQPMSGESMTISTVDGDGARADVAADGFWGTSHQRAFFDVAVVNPFSDSYKGLNLPAVYRKVEARKKRKYDVRIREVEHGSFSPLVFSTNGGLAPVCDIVFRRIALLTADKLNKPYTSVINFIRCKLSFSILRSTIRCVRGTRRSIYRPSDCDIDVAISDARLQCH